MEGNIGTPLIAVMVMVLFFYNQGKTIKAFGFMSKPIKVYFSSIMLVILHLCILLDIMHIIKYS